MAHTTTCLSQQQHANATLPTALVRLSSVPSDSGPVPDPAPGLTDVPGLPASVPCFAYLCCAVLHSAAQTSGPDIDPVEAAVRRMQLRSAAHDPPPTPNPGAAIAAGTNAAEAASPLTSHPRFQAGAAVANQQAREAVEELGRLAPLRCLELRACTHALVTELARQSEPNGASPGFGAAAPGAGGARVVGAGAAATGAGAGVATAAAGPQQLRRLVLRDLPRLTAAEVGAVAAALRGLEVLDVRGCGGVDPRAVPDSTREAAVARAEAATGAGEAQAAEAVPAVGLPRAQVLWRP